MKPVPGGRTSSARGYPSFFCQFVVTAGQILPVLSVLLSLASSGQSGCQPVRFVCLVTFVVYQFLSTTSFDLILVKINWHCLTVSCSSAPARMRASHRRIVTGIITDVAEACDMVDHLDY